MAGRQEGGARSSTTRRQAPASGSLGPTSPKEPHPLHARRPLLPPPSVALEEAGGAALLGGAAEPDSSEKRGVGGASGQEASATRLTRGGGEPWGEMRAPYLLMASSSSESPRLVLSSSLVMRVEELSYPARWRSSLEGPLGLWPPAVYKENLRSQASRSSALHAEACLPPAPSPPTLPPGPAPHRHAHCCLSFEVALVVVIQQTRFLSRAPDSHGCWTH